MSLGHITLTSMSKNTTGNLLTSARTPTTGDPQKGALATMAQLLLASVSNMPLKPAKNGNRTTTNEAASTAQVTRFDHAAAAMTTTMALNPDLAPDHLFNK